MKRIRFKEKISKRWYGETNLHLHEYIVEKILDKFELVQLYQISHYSIILMLNNDNLDFQYLPSSIYLCDENNYYHINVTQITYHFI